MRQRTLFDPLDPLEESWRKFHTAHPDVWRLFSRFAFEAIRASRLDGAELRIGARMIWERMRWETTVVEGARPFRLNDHHVPYYARLFHAENPHFGTVFEIRNQRSKVSS